MPRAGTATTSWAKHIGRWFGQQFGQGGGEGVRTFGAVQVQRHRRGRRRLTGSTRVPVRAAALHPPDHTDS